MSSNINPANIDGTYPIAGQDNDSQGFRDNFTNIKNNFTFAQSEITDLQNKAVLKSALTGSSLSNDFGGAAMNGAQIVDFREKIKIWGDTSGYATLAISHTEGHYHTLTLDSNIAVAFSGFPPSGQLGRVRLSVNVSSTNYSLVLPSTVTVGKEFVKNLTNDGTPTLKFDQTGTFVYEIITTDGGTNYAIFDLSRPKNILNRVVSTGTGQLGDTPGMMLYGEATPGNWFLYICKGYYDGSTAIWRKVALGSI